MTIETLRQAASAIRIDTNVAYQRGHSSIRQARTMRGVADWLDEVATHLDAAGDEGLLLEDTIDRHALTVATAFLGGVAA